MVFGRKSSTSVLELIVYSGHNDFGLCVDSAGFTLLSSVSSFV